MARLLDNAIRQTDRPTSVRLQFFVRIWFSVGAATIMFYRYCPRLWFRATAAAYNYVLPLLLQVCSTIRFSVGAATILLPENAICYNPVLSCQSLWIFLFTLSRD